MNKAVSYFILSNNANNNTSISLSHSENNEIHFFLLIGKSVLQINLSFPFPTISNQYVLWEIFYLVCFMAEFINKTENVQNFRIIFITKIHIFVFFFFVTAHCCQSLTF